MKHDQSVRHAVDATVQKQNTGVSLMALLVQDCLSAHARYMDASDQISFLENGGTQFRSMALAQSYELSELLEARCDSFIEIMGCLEHMARGCRIDPLEWIALDAVRRRMPKLPEAPMHDMEMYLKQMCQLGDDFAELVHACALSLVYEHAKRGKALPSLLECIEEKTL